MWATHCKFMVDIEREKNDNDQSLKIQTFSHN